MSDNNRLCGFCGRVFSADDSYVYRGQYARYCSKRCAREAEGITEWNGSDGGCFITTAVCRGHNLPDDCEELQVLRRFRDEHMQESAEGRALVQEYYDIAPKLVSKINSRPNSSAVYSFIRKAYIDPAVNAAKSGQNADAQQIYTELVRFLKDRF